MGRRDFRDDRSVSPHARRHDVAGLSRGQGRKNQKRRRAQGFELEKPGRSQGDERDRDESLHGRGGDERKMRAQILDLETRADAEKSHRERSVPEGLEEMHEHFRNRNRKDVYEKARDGRDDEGVREDRLHGLLPEPAPLPGVLGPRHRTRERAHRNGA